MQVVDLSRQTRAHGQGTSSAGDRRPQPQTEPVHQGGCAIADQTDGSFRGGSKPALGADLRPQLAVRLGDTLTLELADGVAVAGRVIWTSGSDCGVKLDRNLDCANPFIGLTAWSGLSIASSDNPPSSRPAARGDSGTPVDARADKSQSGLKAVHDGSFAEGLAVKVSLPLGPERRGVVCWSEANIARVIVLEPIAAEPGSVREFRTPHDTP